MRQFPLFWNDWEHFLLDEWRRQSQKMRDYIEVTERAFEKEQEAVSDAISKEAEQISDEDREWFDDESALKLMALHDDFPVMARHMAFCGMYAYFEHELIYACDALMVFRKLSKNVRNERGKGIERAKTYLKKVAKIAFPDTTGEWGRIAAYNRIRNLVMHNQSRVPRSHIRTFEADVTNTGEIPIDDFQRFILSKRYCLAAIDTYQAFFDALKRVLPRETQQDRKEAMDTLEKLYNAAKDPRN